MFRNVLIGIVVAVLVFSLGMVAFYAVGFNATAPLAGFGARNTAQGGGAYRQGGGRNSAAGTTTSFTPGNGNRAGTSLINIPTSELSSEEAAALLFMREEEKLARDVYNAMYSTWKLPIFQKIAASEQTHMDQIGMLIVRYNLTDPAKTEGAFTNANLQALYTKLVAQGNQSIGAALKVGGAIEEIDIKDLLSSQANTDNADIQQVYSNLTNASYNHLNAFARNLSTQTGETYLPQYLSADVYKTIVSAAGNAGGRPAWAGNAGGQRTTQP